MCAAIQVIAHEKLSFCMCIHVPSPLESMIVVTLWTALLTQLESSIVSKVLFLQNCELCYLFNGNNVPERQCSIVPKIPATLFKTFLACKRSWKVAVSHEHARSNKKMAPGQKQIVDCNTTLREVLWWWPIRLRQMAIMPLTAKRKENQCLTILGNMDDCHVVNCGKGASFQYNMQHWQ